MNKNIKNTYTGFEIAVIGISCRLPGAKNIDEFWTNLINGTESISFFSDEELKESGVSPGLLNEPNYVKAGGMLDDIEYFDASFFGYTPKEAKIMTPQTRIFYECVYEALEDAGYASEHYDGLVGLYAGASISLVWEALTILSGKSNELGQLASTTLANKDSLCTRISYKLDLRGPAISLRTACSTSLVAIHLACRALLTMECDIALAGGIAIQNYRKNGYISQEGLTFSLDGHCRPFDAKAKGTIFGDGAGVVVLKKLNRALKDGDHIYSMIKGSAINNDGYRKGGYTAPSVEGQIDVIKMAQKIAGVSTDSISYIETHGTGTHLGDTIEIEALKLVFGVKDRKFCALGSVKSNIGHLDSAAGVVSLIKVVLAMKYKLIPSTLHFEIPGPEIDFENTPFYVNKELKVWENGSEPLRSSVSAFGLGGTNAHVILEESPGREESTESREWQLILLSAKTGTALDRTAIDLAEFLRQNHHTNLADMAYTLQMGRRAFKFRKMLVCSTVNEAITALSTQGKRKAPIFFPRGKNRPVFFMFSGLGSQYVNMGRGLYENEPVFRDRMNRCFELVEPLTGFDIKEILYPRQEDASDPSRIREFEIAQLVVFCFEYALTRLLLDWGVTPDAMIGYSFGEYVAAAVSGVFSLEDALKLIVSRGKLMGTLPRGAMLSVPMLKEELVPLLEKSLSIAIDNGPTCIVAGTGEDIKALEEQLKEKKFICFPMDSSYALHTKMMAPILPKFEKTAAAISIHKPQIPYISNLTGKWQTAGDVAKPSYWAKHMGETVRFDNGIKELLKKENALFIEIGPGRDLSAMVGRYFGNKADHHTLNLVRPADQDTPDLYYLLNKIGRLWLLGQQIDWQAFYAGQTRHRLPLPTYPFEKQRYWIDYNQVKYGLNIMKEKPMTQTPANTGSHDEEPLSEAGPDETDFKSRPQLMNPYSPPRNRIEEKVAGVWQDLFGFDRIGIDDNFLELGGDSLKAVNMVAQLKKIGVPVALQNVLANPTIRQLASLIGEMNDMDQLMAKLQEEKLLSTLDCIEKLNNGQNEKNIFLVHPRHGMLVQYYDFARELENDYNVYGIQARGVVRGERLSESPYEMIDDYVEQVLKVQPNGPFILGGYCAGRVISYVMTLRLEEMGHSVEHLIYFDSPPLLSPRLIKILRLLERSPGFVRKAFRCMHKRKFKKAKLDLELNGEKIGIDEVEDIPEVGRINKRVKEHVLFLERHMLPLEIIKVSRLITRCEDTKYWDFIKFPEEDYRDESKGKISFVVSTGNHNNMFFKPHVVRLAEDVVEYLRESDINSN